MSKKDYYNITKNVNKIIRKEPTNFLDHKTYQEVIKKLKNIKYNTYYPYAESEKVIIYIDEIPKIRLLEIISYDKLDHRSIMGSLYGLNIDSGLFGDIIIWNNHYYIMILDSIYDYVINEYNMVGNKHIKLKEVPLSIISDYQRQYEEINLIVSSLRIDNVVAKIVGMSRNNIKEKFDKEEIFINYEPCHKLEYLLHEEDIFSIRKYGKYKYDTIIKKSKKDNYVIRCFKYIDN